jgi:hypothetical protein
LGRRCAARQSYRKLQLVARLRWIQKSEATQLRETSHTEVCRHRMGRRRVVAISPPGLLWSTELPLDLIGLAENTVPTLNPVRPAALRGLPFRRL